MNLSSDIIATILFLGAAQGFVLSLVLSTIRRGNHTANRILAIVVVIFSISIAVHTLTHTTQIIALSHHAELVAVIYLLIGPALYFYVKALTESEFRLSRRASLHLVSFGVGAVLLIVLFSQSPQITQSHGIHRSQTDCSICLVISFGLIVQTFVYLFLIIKTLRRHSNAIKESFSSIERINLNWLHFLIVGYLSTWLIALFLEAQHIETRSWDYGWIVVSAFLYLIGYHGLRQPEIFSGHLHSEEKEKKARRKKYEKSTLTPAKADKYLQKLKQVMETEKPFLKHDLTLAGLAKMLSVSTHHLSQVINEKTQQNFFEYINSHRVEAAKQMIVDPKNNMLGLAEIAYQAGFNSVTSFNSAFKKHTGMTPSQFKNTSFEKSVSQN